jgi:hypothetical protein
MPAGFANDVQMRSGGTGAVPQSLSAEQIRYLRLRAQRLLQTARHPPDGVAEVASALCGIQAQYQDSAMQAIRVRSQGLLAAQVSDARVKARSVVRTWCMRGTLHLLATADTGWLLSLLGPISIRKSRHRYAALGLSEEICARAVRAMRQLLGDTGPMTRAELACQLSKRGIPTEGQAIYHLLRRAGLEGVICFGPDSAGEPTYVALDDWAPTGRALDEQQALGELARRYLAGHGPALAADLAAWSGLPLRSARTGLEHIARDLLRVELDGGQAWILKTQERVPHEPFAQSPAVRMLPGYDPYLVGYRSRDMIAGPQHAKQIHPGGGVIRPTVVVNGRAAGTWKSLRRASGLSITVEPFERLDDRTWQAIQEEVDDLGRFYQEASALEEQP